MKSIDRTAISTESNADVSSSATFRRRTGWRFVRRLWVLPVFTLVVLGVFAFLLGHARPLEAQTLRPNLTLVKTGPAFAQIGSQVVYTLLLGNTGLAPASNVTVVEQTPPGLVLVGFGGACSGATCTFPTLTVGAIRTIRVTFTIPSDYNLIANPIITNTAFVTSTSRESTLIDNTGIWATLPFAVADLELSKTANSDVIARGENVTYTLTLTNNGPQTAFAVSILDLMTPTLPFVNGSDTPCSFVPVLTGTIALCNNVMAGETVVLTAVHAVPLDWVTPTVMNVGLAGTVSVEPNYFNNVATQTITITDRADMSITKEGPPAIVPGTDAVFTLTVKNLGPSIATTVTVEDAGFNELPPNAIDAPCESFPCDLGDLWPNSITQIVMTYSVPSDFNETEVTNTATVTTSVEDPQEDNNSSSVTVPVVLVSDLAIQKDAPASAVPGTPITYTLVVTNNGPSDAYEVTLTDMDPISLTAAGNPCDAGVCSLPDLPVGMSRSLTLIFDVDPFARGTVTNTASVTSTGTPTPVAATALTKLTPEADLSISKTDGQDVAPFGTAVTYTVVVTNSGPSGVAGAQLVDQLPAFLNEVKWTCAAVAPNACGTASGEGDINIGLTLAPGGVATVTASGMLPTSGENDLINTAEISAPADVTETNPSDNRAEEFTNLIYLVDVAVMKTVTPADSIAPGELFTYAIVVGNAGPSKAEDVSIVDYPSWKMINPAWVCEAGAGAECNAASGMNFINESVSLEPGSLVTYTLIGTLDLQARGYIYNEANAYVNQAKDSYLQNNAAWVETPIQSKAFVSIGKSNGQTEVAPGSMVTYVITLTNDGPSNANGLVYDDFPSLLSNAQWMSASLDGGQVISDLAGITTLPGVQVDLPAGSALTITVYGDLSLTATGWLTNTAQFEIGLETPDEGNGECASNCGFMLKEVFPPENEPNPIINTNSITKAIDVDQILQSRVVLGAWNDLDGNGYLNFGEPMLPGVRIVITGNTLSAVEVVLDANGLFTQPVPPGPYTSTLAPGGAPPGFVQTSSPVVWNGSVAAGGMVTWYVGLQGRGSVAGIAFNDVDGNLDQGVSEPGLSGVVVTITGAAGEVQPSRAQTAIVMTTTTDAGGHYTFTKVPAGGYMLNAQAPAGYVNTTQLPKNVVVEPAGNSVNILGFQKPGALHVSKAAQSSQASNQLGPDRLITYTLTVTNTGGGLLNDVLVTDTLPAHLQYVNGSASLAPVSVIPLVWQVNSMMPGESVSVRFVTRVADNFNDLVLNTAIAGSRQTLSVQSNEVVIMPAPTAISIVRFTARRGQDGVTVAWITGFERDTFGFNVFRSATGNRADAIQVNASLIPAGAKGGQYAFVDSSAEAGVTYTYWLQEIEISGAVIDYLEAAVTMPMSDQAAIGYRVFMPVLMR